MPLTKAFIALGSNLGDRQKTISEAVARIADLQATKLIRKSDLIETKPVDSPDDAGMFVNGVVQVETKLEAKELLNQLLNIEVELGRDRTDTVKNAPRIIDLDILLYGNECISGESLQIPHPRMSERLFVLWPLMQIAPRLVDPRDGSFFADAYDRLSNSS